MTTSVLSRLASVSSGVQESFGVAADSTADSIETAGAVDRVGISGCTIGAAQVEADSSDSSDVSAVTELTEGERGGVERFTVSANTEAEAS